MPYYPYPPVSGGNVRIFNLIKRLSKYYEIHILSYFDKEISNDHIKALETYCEKVIVVERKQCKGSLPLIFQHYTTPEMTKELDDILKNSYDFIQIDFLTMAHYIFQLKEKTNIPVFFTEHDVSSFYFEKCFHNRHLPEKERYIEWIKMRKTMARIYPVFDAVFTVSYNDERILKKEIPGLNVRAVPTGTDCGFYKFRPCRSSNDLIYVGHFLHYPNVDSVEFFLEEIFPLVEVKYPQINFNITGSGGKKKFRDLKKGNVTVTGCVGDIRDCLYGAGIFVAPVRLGIGIRGKILEAMATGLPVISTSLGAEGIEAEEENHLLIADEPEEFLKQIDRLIGNKELRKKLVYNARKFVETNYNWPAIVEKNAGLYEKILGK